MQSLNNDINDECNFLVNRLKNTTWTDRDLLMSMRDINNRLQIRYNINVDLTMFIAGGIVTAIESQKQVAINKLPSLKRPPTKYDEAMKQKEKTKQPTIIVSYESDHLMEQEPDNQEVEKTKHKSKKKYHYDNSINIDDQQIEQSNLLRTLINLGKKCLEVFNNVIQSIHYGINTLPTFEQIPIVNKNNVFPLEVSENKNPHNEKIYFRAENNLGDNVNKDSYYDSTYVPYESNKNNSELFTTLANTKTTPSFTPSIIPSYNNCVDGPSMFPKNKYKLPLYNQEKYIKDCEEKVEKGIEQELMKFKKYDVKRVFSDILYDFLNDNEIIVLSGDDETNPVINQLKSFETKTLITQMREKKLIDGEITKLFKDFMKINFKKYKVRGIITINSLFIWFCGYLIPNYNYDFSKLKKEDLDVSFEDMSEICNLVQQYMKEIKNDSYFDKQKIIGEELENVSFKLFNNIKGYRINLLSEFKSNSLSRIQQERVEKDTRDIEEIRREHYLYERSLKIPSINKTRNYVKDQKENFRLGVQGKLMMIDLIISGLREIIKFLKDHYIARGNELWNRYDDLINYCRGAKTRFKLYYYKCVSELSPLFHYPYILLKAEVEWERIKTIKIQNYWMDLENNRITEEEVAEQMEDLTQYASKRERELQHQLNELNNRISKEEINIEINEMRESLNNVNDFHIYLKRCNDVSYFIRTKTTLIKTINLIIKCFNLIGDNDAIILNTVPLPDLKIRSIISQNLQFDRLNCYDLYITDLVHRLGVILLYLTRNNIINKDIQEIYNITENFMFNHHSIIVLYNILVDGYLNNIVRKKFNKFLAWFFNIHKFNTKLWSFGIKLIWSLYYFFTTYVDSEVNFTTDQCIMENIKIILYSSNMSYYYNFFYHYDKKNTRYNITFNYEANKTIKNDNGDEINIIENSKKRKLIYREDPNEYHTVVGDETISYKHKYFSDPEYGIDFNTRSGEYFIESQYTLISILEYMGLIEEEVNERIWNLGKQLKIKDDANIRLSHDIIQEVIMIPMIRAIRENFIKPTNENDNIIKHKIINFCYLVCWCHDFILKNGYYQSIAYDSYIFTDARTFYNARTIDANYFTIPLINVIGLNTNNKIKAGKIIRNVNIFEIEYEINRLKYQLGFFVNLYIGITVTLNRNYYEETRNIRYDTYYKQMMAETINYDDMDYYTARMPIIQSYSRTIWLPLNKLKNDFLSGGEITEKAIREMFEEYDNEDISSNNSLFGFNEKLVKRIELGLDNIFEEKTVQVEANYIPMKIISDQSNPYLDLLCYNMQIFTDIHKELTENKYDDFNLSCFVWSLLRSDNIQNLLSDDDIYFIKLRYGVGYCGLNQLREFSDKFDITLIIKKLVYQYGCMSYSNRHDVIIEPSHFKVKGIKRSEKMKKQNHRQITLGLLKYGTIQHFIPYFKTNITSYCCKYLNISNPNYYNIISKENNEIIDNEIQGDYYCRRIENKNSSKYASTLEVLNALLLQRKLTFLSNYEMEKYSEKRRTVPISLKSIDENNTAQYELIKEMPKDSKCLTPLTWFAVADTETFIKDENDNKKLIPYCICLSIFKNNKCKTLNFYGINCQFDFLDYCCKNDIHNVYFHNLRFDGWLFKDYLIREMILHGNRLYSLTIVVPKKNIQIKQIDETTEEIKKKGFVITLKDSLGLINSALKNFPKMFGFEELEKELFPYNLLTEENYKNNKFKVDDCKKEFNEKDFNKFLKNCNEIGCLNGDEIDLKILTIHYCNRDVELLLKGLLKFQELTMRAFNGVNGLFFTTISGLSYHIMRVNCFIGLEAYRGDIEKYIRETIRGGRCMVQNNTKIIVNDEVVDFDACSLYPSAMKRLKLPTGHCYCLSTPNEIKKMFENNLMLEDQIIPTSERFISYMMCHVKILKVGINRSFPLLSYHNKGVNIYTNDVVGREMYLTSLEIEDFIKYQKGEIEFISAIYWIGEKDTRMSEYIEKCYNLRKKYKAEKNPLQEIFKLFMNSSYGKTIQKPIKEEKLFYNKLTTDIYKSTHYGIIKNITEINEDTYMITKEGCGNIKFIPAQIGSLILAMSKRIMNEVMVLAEDNKIPIFYQDTDSIHMLKKDVNLLEELFKKEYGRNLIGSNMGEFHVDFPLINNLDTWSRKSIFLGKKSYLDILVNSQQEEQLFIRMKGIPQDVIINTAKDMKCSVEDIYMKLYHNESINFNLLNSSLNKFEFTKDFQIFMKTKFERNISFNK